MTNREQPQLGLNRQGAKGAKEVQCEPGPFWIGLLIR
jgi:hypothetical protein